MKYLLCLAVLAVPGCAGAGSLYQSAEYQKRPSLNESLVRDDKAMLSQEAIQRLLESKIRIPDRVKLAVLPLGHAGSQGGKDWGYGFTRPMQLLQEHKQYLSALETPLAETGRFSEITHVPSLMLPAEPSLTRLREAAALMQADLLLVYSTRSQLVTWTSIFVKDEVRATAAIELILIDIRTGVVPYAETFDDDHLEYEASDDVAIVDTQRRAERVATLKVMTKAAGGLKRFMSP